MADLRVKMGSLELGNPIIISSGHLTRTGDDIKRCDKYGGGAVVIKSGFLEKEYEKVVKPYAPGLFPDARPAFHSTGDGFVSICGLSPIPVEVWAKWFKDNIKEIKTPVIASIMAISVEGYIKGAKMFQEAGAEALEILLGCPLPYLMPHRYVGGASLNAAIVEEVCSAVRKAVDIPLGVKMMFNPFDPSPLQIPRKVGLDWLTIAMAMPAAPGINLDEVEPVMPSSVFISGSKVAKHASFVALLAQAGQHRDIHVSISGGTQIWSDVVEFLMYGASSVQVQTLFLHKGMGVIKGFKKSISDYMDSKGFGSIEEMKGVILPKLLTYDEVIATYGATKGKIVVSVDQEKCIDCGVCEEVCNFGAIKVIDGKVKIVKEKCEGCNACVCSCTQEALWLENVDLV
ncbi:MAG TPA: 4Fe-4S binding protein, partial [Syntrophales bacterium]|nr:4Fe-4S binding protein [Syntrophales bacterium]